MAIKLVAFDMDGTALTSDKQLPPHFNDEIRRLHDKGIICAPATGRFFSTVADKFGEISQLMSCVSCNGHELHHEGKLISLHTFNPNTVLQLSAFADRFENLFSVVFTADDGFVCATPQTWPYRASMEYGPMTLCDSFVVDDSEHPIIKCSFYSDHNIEKYCDIFNNEVFDIDQTVHGVVTSEVTFDVSLNGMNKGRGLAELAAHLGIDMSEVMALGDHMNDYEMIELAGDGVAVANAIPQIKQIANRITVSNDEYAVLKEMQKL